MNSFLKNKEQFRRKRHILWIRRFTSETKKVYYVIPRARDVTGISKTAELGNYTRKGPDMNSYVKFYIIAQKSKFS